MTLAMELLADSSLITIACTIEGDLSLGAKKYLDSHSWLLGISRSSNNHLGGSTWSNTRPHSSIRRNFSSLLPIGEGSSTMTDYKDIFTYSLGTTQNLVAYPKILSRLDHIENNFHANWAPTSCGTRYEYLGPFDDASRSSCDSSDIKNLKHKTIPLYFPVGSSIPSGLMHCSEVLEIIMEILDNPTTLTAWILGNRSEALKFLGKNLGGIREVIVSYYDIVVPKITSFPIPFLAVSGATPDILYRKVISNAQDFGFRKMQNMLYLLEASRVFSLLYVDSRKRLESSGGVINEFSRPLVSALRPLPTLKGFKISDDIWSYILTISRVQESKGYLTRRTEKEVVSTLLLNSASNSSLDPLKVTTILFDMDILQSVLSYFRNYVDNYYESNLIGTRSVGNSYGLVLYKRGLKDMLPTGATYPKKTPERRLLYRVVSDFKSLGVDLIREHFSALLFCFRVHPLINCSGPSWSTVPNKVGEYTKVECSHKAGEVVKRLIVSKILSLDTLCFSKLVNELLRGIKVGYDVENKALEQVVSAYSLIGLEMLPKLIKSYYWSLQNTLSVKVTFISLSSGTNKTLDLKGLLRTLILRLGDLVRKDLDNPTSKRELVSYQREYFHSKNLDEVVAEWVADRHSSNYRIHEEWSDSRRFNRYFYDLIKIRGVSLGALLEYWRSREELRLLVQEWLPRVVVHISNLVEGYAAKSDGYTSRFLGMFFIDLTRTLTEMQGWYRDNT